LEEINARSERVNEVFFKPTPGEFSNYSMWVDKKEKRYKDLLKQQTSADLLITIARMKLKNRHPTTRKLPLIIIIHNHFYHI